MIWNVNPVLFHLGPYQLRYYSLFLFLGVVLIGIYLQGVFKKYYNNPDLVFPLITYLISGGMIGARLVHCFFYAPEHYISHPGDILKVWQGGLASHGGFLGCFLAVWIIVKTNKGLTYFSLMDLIIGPCLFVAGLIRIGNLFNSEILGDATDMPWGVVFERVDNIARHPVQIYESLAYILIAFFLGRLVKKYFQVWREGLIFSTALILTCTFRFFIEFLKNDLYETAVNTGQFLSLFFIGAGIGLIFFLKRSSR